MISFLFLKTIVISKYKQLNIKFNFVRVLHNTMRRPLTRLGDDDMIICALPALAPTMG